MYDNNTHHSVVSHFPIIILLLNLKLAGKYVLMEGYAYVLMRQELVNVWRTAQSG